MLHTWDLVLFVSQVFFLTHNSKRFGAMDLSSLCDKHNNTGSLKTGDTSQK